MSVAEKMDELDQLLEALQQNEKRSSLEDDHQRNRKSTSSNQSKASNETMHRLVSNNQTPIEHNHRNLIKNRVVVEEQEDPAGLTELNDLLDELYEAKKVLVPCDSQQRHSTSSSSRLSASTAENGAVIKPPSSSASSPTSSASSSSATAASGSLLRMLSGQNNESSSASSLRRKSVDKLLGLVADSSSSLSSLNFRPISDRTSKSKPTPIVNTVDASRELEDLMNSLTMYKKDDQDGSVSHRNSGQPRVQIQQRTSGHEYQERTFDSNSNSNSNSNSIRNSSQRISVNRSVCNACQNPITGQVITALGCLWHPEHFRCHHCNCVIGTSIFYEKDNMPYCERDYLDIFSPKCAQCSRAILDKMLTALDKPWHIDCFTCASCKKPLNDESFLEINNAAYCKKCYENKLAPKCKRCQGAIVDNFISALEAYWHPGCFVCQECSSPFNSSSFFEYNSMPYCELHYHLKRGSLCSSCQLPINGRCVTAMNKKFHPEHFVCSFCQRLLNKGTFKEQNEKPFCHACFQKLFPS